MGSAGRPRSERVVVVVDDDEAVCHFTARILTDAGFSVLQAHSGREAVTLLSTLDGRVQLVVSDITMPAMTGVELATLMATRWPSTPILLISGQGRPPDDYRGPFLPKPFLPETLVDAVSELLGSTPQHSDPVSP